MSKAAERSSSIRAPLSLVDSANHVVKDAGSCCFGWMKWAVSRLEDWKWIMFVDMISESGIDDVIDDLRNETKVRDRAV